MKIVNDIPCDLKKLEFKLGILIEFNKIYV
jgi:hypothetical protein